MRQGRLREALPFFVSVHSRPDSPLLRQKLGEFPMKTHRVSREKSGSFG